MWPECCDILLLFESALNKQSVGILHQLMETLAVDVDNSWIQTVLCTLYWTCSWTLRQSHTSTPAFILYLSWYITFISTEQYWPVKYIDLTMFICAAPAEWMPCPTLLKGFRARHWVVNHQINPSPDFPGWTLSAAVPLLLSCHCVVFSFSEWRSELLDHFHNLH